MNRYGNGKFIESPKGFCYLALSYLLFIRGTPVFIFHNPSFAIRYGITANGSVSYLNPLASFDHDGAQYNMTGTEKYLNSGFIWPEGNVPKGFSNISTFTIRIQDQGVYQFLCIHPEMSGAITVGQPSTSMGTSIQ